jgi:misacylated tRNA(Ala) deacylase
MTELLYMTDCYLREFDAIVTKVDRKLVFLDKTAFYPESGGQLTDTGKLIKVSGEEFTVVFAKKAEGDVLHEVDKEGLRIGDKVHGILDWGRRYLMMQYHTAAHVLSTVIYNETNANITGNQLGLDKSRVDFDLELFDREQLGSYEAKTNAILKKALPVSIRIMPRDEAFKIPALVKLKKVLPETIKDIRVVSIEGFDQQACAGAHVGNLGEVGEIEIISLENKGKSRRRIYFKLK